MDFVFVHVFVHAHMCVFTYTSKFEGRRKVAVGGEHACYLLFDHLYVII